MSRNLPSAPASSSSRRDTGLSSRSREHPAVESAVTRLLVSIKQLLDSLNQWSTLKIDENDVSDVYVKLGNDFNAAVQAFAAFGIEMEELSTVPDDLRVVLEQCLAEDATAENLDIYLPTIRGIITGLLQGLRGKQSVYRRIVSDAKRSEQASGHERSVSGGTKSSRSHAPSGSVSRGHRTNRSITDTREGGARESLRRSGVSSGSRRGTPSSPYPISHSQGDENVPFIGGFSPVMSRDNEEQQQSEYSPPRAAPTIFVDELPQQPPTHSMAAPSSMKRYSLVDKPVPSSPSSSSSPLGMFPAVIVEPSSPMSDAGSAPTSPPPPPIESTPAMASSLAALKKSDTLERRASKRFSTYNISKMTGTRERVPRGDNRQANRRSLAASSALTPSELATLTEADDDDELSTPVRANGAESSRPVTPAEEQQQQQQQLPPPIPPLPQSTYFSKPSPSVTPEPAPPQEYARPAEPPPIAQAPEPVAGGRLTVFLQLGREVKKATIEPGLSFSSLRVLFVDRFSYNPGKDNFPAIYIRDPASGVQYELEDMDEVKDKCLLSLNIEPLDQIKQHIDSQISTLSQDIKELKTSIVSQPILLQQPGTPSSPLGPPMAESTPMHRPSDRQFQHVARRLSRFVASSNSSESLPSLHQMPHITGGIQPQITGNSVVSEYSSRVVSDLKTQFDEVQNLRRDLGIMRQLYTEFMKQTKESLGTLRGQAKSVKQLATTGVVGGARGFIESGKQKLDERSQNVLTEIEKLQDSVEQVRDDVIKRHTTPKVFFFKGIKKDIDRVRGELQSLHQHVGTIKPMWKKTWEEELQNIVEEQQFLTHQEEFLADLMDDHKALGEVFGHIEQIISIRGTSVGGSRGGGGGGSAKSFRPPPLEEGHTGLSTVMMELRGAQMDPEKRMKAIEANQKIRKKELEANQNDDMQAELSEFVEGKKLKMTGGAEEIERVRQKRSEQTLKAMFTGPHGNLSISDMSMPPSPSAF